MSLLSVHKQLTHTPQVCSCICHPTPQAAVSEPQAAVRAEAVGCLAAVLDGLRCLPPGDAKLIHECAFGLGSRVVTAGDSSCTAPCACSFARSDRVCLCSAAACTVEGRLCKSCSSLASSLQRHLGGLFEANSNLPTQCEHHNRTVVQSLYLQR